MAEERQGEAVARLTGFEKYSTETLQSIHRKQEEGLAEVHRRWEAGTVNERPKPGAATPKEAGETIMMLHDGITAELRRRGVIE